MPNCRIIAYDNPEKREGNIGVDTKKTVGKLGKYFPTVVM